MHVRNQIRDAVVALLTGLPETGSRVYKARVYPLHQVQLPGLLVFTKEEDSQRLNQNGDLVRDLVILVQAYVRATAAMDDDIDQIAVECEEALESDPTLSGLVKNYAGIGATRISTGVQNEMPYGVGEFEFLYTYVTGRTDSQTAL
jgi:hypothetical protein